MADISVTPASVLASATALTASGVSGATILAGQPLYIDTANSNVLKLADANASALTATVCGIALHGASSGQPLKYVYEDSTFTPGATLTVGQTYAVSATAGGIAPIADLTTGDYPGVLFVAKTTTTAVLRILRGTAAKS
jgi:hypothetical protein